MTAARHEAETELATKDADLIKAVRSVTTLRSENEKLSTGMKEMTDRNNRQVAELTEKMDAAVGRADGLLAFVRYATSEMRELSDTDRLEYVAGLMDFSFEQAEVADRLEKLVKNPEGHEEHHAARYRELRPGTVEVKLNDRLFAEQMAGEKRKIAESMQADVERLRVARSNIIPTDVMNEVFELLSVTREQVLPLWAAKRQERKRR